MSLFVTSLNSGSNGNCYYIGNDNEAILVDAGISCREVEKRMSRLQLSMQKIKAIFISHEHIDHIRGLVILSRKYQLPVYITPLTLKNSFLQLEKELVRAFTAEIPVAVGDLVITPFSKHHDAKDPHSFIVSGNGINVGVLTDIGMPCETVIKYFKQCHAVFLETNYDEEMLENGRYPYHLKKRIRGGKGHLSNKQALQLYLEHRPGFMSHLFLSHLSHENNCPRLVKELFVKETHQTAVVVATRHCETDVFCIRNNAVYPEAQVVFSKQMKLFELNE